MQIEKDILLRTYNVEQEPERLKNRYKSQKQIRKKQGKGAHVEPVLSEENQAVGRDLGQFYKKNNIKENDMFDVKIVD